jgi:hypothetical protein
MVLSRSDAFAVLFGSRSTSVYINEIFGLSPGEQSHTYILAKRFLDFGQIG